ncbi:MAG: hypothetical protein Q7Q73_16775 [Verrucomicrobiota bacterium JB024]|nr:hypothetical protein [Verrucomicrobiota bacterium JB024]
MYSLSSGFLAFTLLVPLIAHSEPLPNSSFEVPDSVRSDVPKGWVKSPADVEGAWDDTFSKDGNLSLRIDASTTSSPYGSIWITEDRIPAVPGQSYELTGWIKTLNAWGDNEIAFSWFDAHGKWIKTDRSPAVNGTRDWTFVTLTATPPPNAASFRVTAGRKYRTESGGSSWFDQLTLSQAELTSTIASPQPASVPRAPFPGPEIPRFPPVQVDTTRPSPSPAPIENEKEWNISLQASDAWLPLDLPETSADSDDHLVIPVPSAAGAGWMTRASIPVHPGSRYALSAIVSLDNALGNTHLAILWQDSDGREIKRATSPVLNGLEYHRLVSFQATAPANATSARIAFLRRTRVSDIPGAGASICEQIVFRDCVLSPPRQENLVANASAEELFPPESSPSPRAWHRIKPKDAQLELETRVPYDGSHALSIAQSYDKDTGWASDPFPVSGSAGYQLALRLRLDNTANVRIAIEWFDASNQSLAVTEATVEPGLWQDWHPFRLLLQSPKNAASARVLLTQSRSSGRASFDDFQFTAR